MWNRLWTIGVKVPDLNRELEMHARLGNAVILDETVAFAGKSYRLPLLRVADKYMHLGERMIYEDALGLNLPCGIVHLVYTTGDFASEVRAAEDAGAYMLLDPAEIIGGFGRRKIAFFRSPGGMIFEIIEILENRVPEV
jgi:hypothetical protein